MSDNLNTSPRFANYIYRSALHAEHVSRRVRASEYFSPPLSAFTHPTPIEDPDYHPSLWPYEGYLRWRDSRLARLAQGRCPSCGQSPKQSHQGG
jgi:hypothetical protein